MFLKGESQSVFHKAVLNGYYEILNLLLDLFLEQPCKSITKLDNIRDHVILNFKIILISLKFKKKNFFKVLSDTDALCKWKRES